MIGTRSSSEFSARFSAPLLLSCSLNPLNSSIVATAVNPISDAFGLRSGQGIVLVVALYVASGIAQPALGKLATVAGPRRVLILGTIVVAAGGLLGTFANSFLLVVLSRAFIGLGTSACFPATMMLIQIRANERGITAPGGLLGAVSLAAQASAAVGLPLGGFLIDLWSWRAIFLINVPLAIGTLVLTLLGTPPDDRRYRPTWRSTAAALDPIGLQLFAGFFVLLSVVLLSVPELNAVLVVMAAALLVALIWWEQRSTAPFIDISMLKKCPGLGMTFLRTLLGMICTYIVLFGLPQWIQGARGESATTAGLATLPMSIVGLLVSGPLGRSGRVRLPVIGASVFMAVVGLSLLFVTSSTSMYLVAGSITVFGFSNAFQAIGNQAALYVQTSVKTVAPAAGLSRTVQYTGAIVASAVIQMSFAREVTDTGLHIEAAVILALSVALFVSSVPDRALPARIDCS